MTAIPSFTGDAKPYGGGDPYADHRTADFPFTQYANLADRRLGAGVIAANDEFFADRENMLVPEPAEFVPENFGHKGKIMDGWETRRRRGASAEHPWPTEEDHDWALVRLGAPGVVRGIVVDTAHFRGNYPQAVSVEGVSVPGAPSPEELLSDDVKWTTLVPRTKVGGHAANGFEVSLEQRFTHLRINQHPDGGIARLRVYGEVAPDPAWLAVLGTFDVVALENGGRAEDASDRFYSPASNTIQPGRSRKMDDGWETPPPRPGQRLDPLPAGGPLGDPGRRDRHGVSEGEQRGLGHGVAAGRRERRVDGDPPAHPPPARHQPPLRPAGPGDGHARARGHLSGRRHLTAAPVRLPDGGGGGRTAGPASGARGLRRPRPVPPAAYAMSCGCRRGLR